MKNPIGPFCVAVIVAKNGVWVLQGRLSTNVSVSPAHIFLPMQVKRPAGKCSAVHNRFSGLKKPPRWLFYCLCNLLKIQPVICRSAPLRKRIIHGSPACAGACPSSILDTFACCINPPSLLQKACPAKAHARWWMSSG